MTQEDDHNACAICKNPDCRNDGGNYFNVGYPTGETFEYICQYCGQRGKATIHNEKKGRRMQGETRKLRTAIFDIIEDIGRRMTVRQVFYQAVSRKVINKTEDEYRRLQRNVLLMRRDGTLPYHYITDTSRLHMKGNSYTSAKDAVNRWIHYYKQDIWANMDVHVEIWLEKKSLAGIISDITNEYDVSLYVSSGFSSESFIYESVETIRAVGKPAYIYFFSDFDKAGRDISKSAEKRFRIFAGNELEIHFNHAGLTEDQIKYYDLPKRPSKDKTKQFEKGSCELDALHPNDLAEIVDDCISQHITIADLEKIKKEEEFHLVTLSKFQGLLFK